MPATSEITAPGTWDGIANRLPLWPLEQCYAYGEAAESLGQKAIRLRTTIGGEVVQAQYLTRRAGWVLRLTQAIRGPVATCWRAEIVLPALAEMRRYLRPGFPSLTLHMPEAGESDELDAPFRRLGFRRIASGYRSAVLDLRPDEVSLRAGHWPEWRNRLAAAERARLSVSTARDGEAVDWVIAQSAAAQASRGYRGPHPRFARSLVAALGVRRVLAVLVSDTSGIVAGGLFLRHGPDATYWLSQTTPEGRRSSATNLLMWTAVRRLKATGVRQLDLGGVDTDRAPGIARFKLGLGGIPLSLAGIYA